MQNTARLNVRVRVRRMWAVRLARDLAAVAPRGTPALLIEPIRWLIDAMLNLAVVESRLEPSVNWRRVGTLRDLAGVKPRRAA